MGKSGNMMNVVKGIAGGMIAGMAVGYAGKKMLEDKPKVKKSANRAIHTMGQFLDTVSYMFR